MIRPRPHPAGTLQAWPATPRATAPRRRRGARADDGVAHRRSPPALALELQTVDRVAVWNRSAPASAPPDDVPFAFSSRDASEGFLTEQLGRYETRLARRRERALTMLFALQRRRQDARPAAWDDAVDAGDARDRTLGVPTLDRGGADASALAPGRPVTDEGDLAEILPNEATGSPSPGDASPAHYRVDGTSTDGG